MSNILNIMITSDLHFGSDNKNVIERQQRTKNKILNDKIFSYIPNILIVDGDLTDHGYNGSKYICSGCMLRKTKNEVGEAKTYLSEFSSKNIKLILNYGNHDISEGDSIRDWIEELYGSVNYVYNTGLGIYIVVCGLYPDKDVCEWIKSTVSTLPPNPMLIFVFHFNISGLYSDWWKESEKDNFFNIIKDYKVLGIVVGHLHETYTQEKNGIKIYSGGGELLSLLVLNNYMILPSY